jgi:hypothetical protein
MEMQQSPPVGQILLFAGVGLSIAVIAGLIVWRFGLLAGAGFFVLVWTIIPLVYISRLKRG